jgi:NAD(P)-dependent dehydrogenase (short-subunit alcohol dehydrogenase family)
MARAPKKVLKGKIALVAGATRGAGRGIAIALGEAGATVYCTGRSSKERTRNRAPRRWPTPGRLKPSKKPLNLSPPLVGTDRGKGDHTKPAEVKRLVAVIKRQHKGLDILVNDVWGWRPAHGIRQDILDGQSRQWATDVEAGGPFTHPTISWCQNRPGT